MRSSASLWVKPQGRGATEGAMRCETSLRNLPRRGAQLAKHAQCRDNNPSWKIQAYCSFVEPCLLRYGEKKRTRAAMNLFPNRTEERVSAARSDNSSLPSIELVARRARACTGGSEYARKWFRWRAGSAAPPFYQGITQTVVIKCNGVSSSPSRSACARNPQEVWVGNRRRSTKVLRAGKERAN